MHTNKILIAAIFVCLSVFAVYWPVSEFEFLNFDDNEYVTENSYVTSGLKTENIVWAFSSQHGSHWHPLSWLSHMLDVEIFGLEAGKHHLVNAALHACNTALALLFFYLLTGRLTLSFVSALIFGLHPLRIESVAWVTERKDVLSIFFILLTFIFYILSKTKHSKSAYCASLITFVLSLLSKPTAVVLPVLLILLDFWPCPTERHKFSIKSIFNKIPFFVGSLYLAIVAIWAQGQGGGLKSVEAYPIFDRVASVLLGYQAYLGKLFIPSGLAIFYPFEQYQPGVAAGAFCLLLVLSFLIWKYRDTYPYLLLGWLWFLVALLPVIGIVQIGGQAFANRWTYLPHIGLILALATFISDKLAAQKASLVTISVGLVAGCVWLSWINLGHWKNSETVFRHAIAVSPDNFMAHMNLGVALDRAGKLAEASKQYDMAVTIKPFYPIALNNLAGARARLGDLLSAEHLYKRALSSFPNFAQARFNLGLLYAQTARPAQALQQWLELAGFQGNYPGLSQNIDLQFKQYSQNGCQYFLTNSAEMNALQGIAAILERSYNNNQFQQFSALRNCLSR